MKVIVFQDHEAKQLLDKLALTEFRIKDRYPEHWNMIQEIHSKFHHDVCVWLQKQGASTI